LKATRRLALAAFAVFAAHSSLTNAEEAVVITATRFPEAYLSAPVGLTVITAEQIGQSAATTLPDLLSQTAGIVVRDNSGSPDKQVDLRGFGMTGDQNTLVLLNGQRLSEIELTTVRWSSIPLASIERIEILRGSGTVLYGGGATGGTINIVTRVPVAGERHANVAGGLGSYGTRDLRGGVSVAGERLGLTLNFSEYDSDNYRSNNRVEQQNLDGDLHMYLPRGQLSFKFGADHQDLRLPGERTKAQLDADPRGTGRPRDYSSRDGGRASLGATWDMGFGEFAAELGYRDNQRVGFFADYLFGGLFDNYVDTRTRVWSFTPRLRLPFEALGRSHNLVVGVDLDDWDYDSRRAASATALGLPAAWVMATQRNQAFYFQYHVGLTEATRLNAGARWQRSSAAANDIVNPGAYAKGSKQSSPRALELSLRHDLTHSTAIYARLANSFRVATVDEGYSQFGGPFFDSIVQLLEPQTSRDHEIGLEHRSGGLRARASYFRIDLNNEIHLFVNPATFFANNVNLPPTRREGLEFDLSWSLNSAWMAFANLSLSDARFRDGVIGGLDAKGKSIPLVPRTKANLGLSWRAGERTRVNGVIHHVGKQVYDNDQANTFPTMMPSHATADLKLTHAVGKVQLGLAVNNLFDKFYYSYAIRNGAGTSFNAYPERGRNLMLSAEGRF
jgi:iron complex outermembrane receptor protein